MADSKISDLAAVTDLQTTDEFVLARSATTKKITGATLAAEIIAGSSGVALIDRQLRATDGTLVFSSIPGSYQDLLVTFCGQAAGGSDVGLAMQFNGDTGANYDHNRVVSVGTSTAAGGANADTLMYMAEVTRVANTSRPGTAEIRIPYYTNTTFYKACHSSFSDLRGTVAGDRITGQGGGLWRSTAAITSITLLTSAGGDLETGSLASLYGFS